MRVIMEPTTGAEHEVPNTRTNSPATAVEIVVQLHANSFPVWLLTDNVICTNNIRISKHVPMTKVSPHPFADKSGNPRATPELLNCAAENGGGWFVRKLATASAW